jgi:hypothetical protein
MIVSSAGRADGKANVEGVARFKTQFAFNHLQVAVKAALAARDFEPRDVGQQIGPWFEGVLQTVPVAIVMSAAALEANANEIIDDILQDLAKQLNDLKNEKFGNYKEKHRKLALILGKVPNCGTVIWEDAGLLVEFRNHFMHFRPRVSFGLGSRTAMTTKGSSPA